MLDLPVPAEADPPSRHLVATREATLNPWPIQEEKPSWYRGGNHGALPIRVDGVFPSLNYSASTGLGFSASSLAQRTLRLTFHSQVERGHRLWPNMPDHNPHLLRRRSLRQLSVGRNRPAAIPLQPFRPPRIVDHRMSNSQVDLLAIEPPVNHPVRLGIERNSAKAQLLRHPLPRHDTARYTPRRMPHRLFPPLPALRYSTWSPGQTMRRRNDDAPCPHPGQESADAWPWSPYPNTLRIASAWTPG